MYNRQKPFTEKQILEGNGLFFLLHSSGKISIKKYSTTPQPMYIAYIVRFLKIKQQRLFDRALVLGYVVFKTPNLCLKIHKVTIQMSFFRKTY